MSLPQKLDNILLAKMAPDEFAQIQADLTYVELPQRECLVAPNETIRNVYFVLSGIISVIAQSDQDRRIEVGIVGREGCGGLPALLGTVESLNEEVVQVAGTALRMPVTAFQDAVQGMPGFRSLMLRYVSSFMTQVSQSMLAVGNDSLGPRLARWLLMCQDRVHAPALPLTHDFLATMLGVRRSGVTETLHILEGEKLIKATRGQILIVDRPGLVKFAGVSYGVPEREYERLIWQY